ncbi:MAG: helix-turn-helix domain-containing protein, partial [Crocinitomicaceae bacterium]
MHNPFEEIVQRLNSIEDLLKNIGLEGVVDSNNKKEAQIITGEELGKKLGVTIQTLIRWRQKGKIPFLQVGSSIRYDLHKVIEALEKKDKVKKVE